MKMHAHGPIMQLPGWLPGLDFPLQTFVSREDNVVNAGDTGRQELGPSPEHPLMHGTLLSPRVLQPRMPGTSQPQLRLRKAEVGLERWLRC